jgi:hypothetical protein
LDNDWPSYSPNISTLKEFNVEYSQTVLNIKIFFQTLQFTTLNGNATNLKEIGACFRELEMLLDGYF